MRIIVVLAAIIIIPVIGSAATIKVPGDYPTIQQAIDASLYGDTVLVSPGTYTESINFNGKAITVLSEKGPDVTVIDGNQSSRVVRFNSCEGWDSILDGFTVTNGKTGVNTSFSSPTIRRNIITNCFENGVHMGTAPNMILINNIISDNTGKNGPGIMCLGSTGALITKNIIANNTSAGYYGGGIFVDAGAPIISNNIIMHNKASRGGGIIVGSYNPTTIKNNIICDNVSVYGGGGIYVYNSAKISNNLIYNNKAGAGGGIYYNYVALGNSIINNNTLIHNKASAGGGGVEYWSPETISNSILWGNTPAQIHAGTNITVTFCDVQGGYPGVGNIDADPLFVQGPNGFFYLSQTASGQPINSPCFDMGSNRASNLGMDIYWTRTDGVPDSSIVDMGFHYGDFLFPSLQTNTFQIQENTGGDADLLLHAGAGNAKRNYIILGSITGTEPGIPLPGGQAILPINWDFFTNLSVDLLNTPIFSNFMGKLDRMGSANAKFDTITPFTGAAGITLHFAYALDNPWNFASNPVGIEIIP